MTAVFSHGRLRLYLLKLLAQGPRHGYELIRLLEHRFLGLYAPSAGTVYPRLARMESDGLVTHTAAGGRKVYEITEAGRAELAHRADELAALEGDIHASVADLSALAAEVERGVRGSVQDLKRELHEAARQAPPAGGRRRPAPGAAPPVAELVQRVTALAADAARWAHQGQVSEDRVRAALARVDAWRVELHRLLRD